MSAGTNADTCPSVLPDWRSDCMAEPPVGAHAAIACIGMGAAKRTVSVTHAHTLMTDAAAIASYRHAPARSAVMAQTGAVMPDRGRAHADRDAHACTVMP